MRRLAHVINTTSQRDLRDSRENILSAVNNGLEAGSAQPIDSQGGPVDGNAAVQAHMTGQVNAIDGGQLGEEKN